MDLLVDRIENPGQRCKTSLKFPRGTPNGDQFERRQSSQDFTRRRSVGSDSSAKRRLSGDARRVSVPVISVNDEPIFNGGPEARARARARAKVGSVSSASRRPLPYNVDYTTASAGMFSDCMFGEKGHKPVVAPRPKIQTNSSSSSSSSILTHGSHRSSYRTEQLKRMPTANGEILPQLPNNLQPEGNVNRYPMHQKNPNRKSNNHALDRKNQRSFSASESNDGKRLVNQFLRSMDLAPDMSTTHFGKSNKETRFPTIASATPIAKSGYDLPTNVSLQNLLYHDLDAVRRNKTQHSARSPYGDNRGLSSSETSSQSALYNHDTPVSSSGSFDSSDELAYAYGSEKLDSMQRNSDVSNGISLNYNEIDYYRRHIGSELNKFEEILKHNLTNVIIKNEHDMVKNLTKFDSLTLELSRLKTRASVLHDQIAKKDLVRLRKDFNKDDRESFLKVLTTAMRANAEQLEELEKRINVCRQKLYQQRDTLRKLEGLLTLEDSLLDSKKTSNVAYRYRYIIFDVGAIAAVIGLVILMKWLFCRHNEIIFA